MPRSIELAAERPGLPQQPVLLLAAGIGATSAAIAASRRLSPAEFEAVLVLGTLVLAGSIAWQVLRSPLALDRFDVSRMAMVLAAVSLSAAALGVVSDVLPWALILIALATGLVGKPAWGLPAAGATILTAIAIGARIRSEPYPEASMPFLAAASATLCLARAAEARIDRTAWTETLLFGAAAAASIVASLAPSRSATPIAFSLIAAATLLAFETHYLSVPRFVPNAHVAFGIIAAIAVGSAATVVVRDLPGPVGSAAVGVIATGTLGAGWLGWQSASAIDRQGKRLAAVARFASVDELTGLANRRQMQGRIEEELARAARYRHDLSLLMVDIDDFKQVNDRLGHRAGDQALRETARSIRSSIRSIDLAARFGGEEFLVVLPETGMEGASIVAERIRQSVQSGTGGLTVSIGVAEMSPEDTDSAAWIERADGALLQAKRLGKNRVVFADPTHPSRDAQS